MTCRTSQNRTVRKLEDSDFTALDNTTGGTVWVALQPDYFGPGDGVYVLREGGGFSCLGFKVCEERRIRYRAWLNAKGVAIPPECCHSMNPGIEAYRVYLVLLGLIKSLCDRMRIRCDVDLSPQLIGKEGQRVEVEDMHGERRRFRVGKSTGWLPIHLEIRGREKYGDGAARKYKSVRVL